MAVDYKDLQKRLAENKVYDALQYVNSLFETLSFMNVSFELLQKVYEHRKSVLTQTQNELFQQGISNPGTPVGITVAHLERTNLTIADYEVNDTLFLRKTALEFFHYARLSIEILSQIVNAALFADDGFPVEQLNLPSKVTNKLSSHATFNNLHLLLKRGIANAEILYLFAFDNYIKHIKTVLITVKNSFTFGNVDQFEISEFCYKWTTHPAVQAIDKALAVKTAVVCLIESVLDEVYSQIPNCLNTSIRFQNVKFKLQIDDTPNGLRYMSFFIEVENDLSELPSEIKVLPLIVKPNDEIYFFDFRYETVFIRVKGHCESDVIGVATIKNGFNTNEFYRIFEVKPCTAFDYLAHTATFAQKNPTISYNIYAMEGTIVHVPAVAPDMEMASDE